MDDSSDFISEKNLSLKKEGKTFGLIYPGYYNKGMSGMTILALEVIVNNSSSWRLERVFLSRDPTQSPTGIENKSRLGDMDVLGFTAQFELDYLVISWMLRRAGMPLSNVKRRESRKFPPIVVGGPCSGANPLPLIDRVDGYFLGDAENSLPIFLDRLDEFGVIAFWENPELFTDIPGFWSPHFLSLHNNKSYSELIKKNPLQYEIGSWYKYFDFVDLNTNIYPLRQILTDLPDYHPYGPVKGQSFQLELGRGCNHGCKFCMIGSGMFSPARYRNLDRLLEIAELGAKETGVNKIDIFGTNLSDFSQLNDLCWELVNKGFEISIATLRPDKVTSEIIEALVNGGTKSLTIAPETGTDDLRTLMGKRVTNEQVLNSTSIIFDGGIPILKDFFLTGLPYETPDDKQALINLIEMQQKIAIASDIEDPLLKVDINPLVPKWQTPLKNWVYHYLPKNRSKLRESMNMFHSNLRRMDIVRPKLVSLQSFLGQTWLTHLIDPINNFTHNIDLKTHIPISRNGAFYLKQFSDILDRELIDIWNKFESSNWEVKHEINSTNRSDDYFTKQARKIMENSALNLI